MPLRDIAVTLAVLYSLPHILKRPHIGILVFAWLSYMNPHRLCWSFAFNLPFAQVVALCTMLSIMFHGAELRKIRMTPLVVVWIAWILWMNVTTVFALNPDGAFGEYVRAMKIQVMTFMTLLLLQDKNRIMWLVIVITASIGFFGVKGGVFTILTGGGHIVFGPPGSFFEGNNALALTMLMVLPLMRYLQLQTDDKRIRNGLTVAMVLTTAAVLASYSRGAFLGAMASGFFLVIKSRHKMAFGAISVLGMVALLMFMPSEWRERIESISDYQNDASAMGRINSWSFAANVANDRPLFGGGFRVFTRGWFGVYAPDPSDFHDAHSIYFEVLGEQGYVGLFLFLLLFFLAFRTGTWIIKHARGDPELEWARDLAGMLQVSLI
ncbi:MAG: putative O-glycosylation ligase, exosortase A system-associated, partial [Gammaproteobacteria bacterium]|nr:putative O-glycosylation ligase, exosortase A system-associated [Gammaproteobacteria bacterium]